MTRASVPPVGGLACRATRLAEQLPRAREFPLDWLVAALALARLVAARSATHPAPAEDLLVGLHLDLADVELTDAYGLPATDPTNVPAGPLDAAARRAILELLGACAETIQSHLECHRDDLAAEQLLAASRAVLHIDAARRCWVSTYPAGASP